MAIEFSELRQDIRLFLSSIRRAMDRSFQGSSKSRDRERFMRSVLMVEEARIRFDTYIGFRAEPGPEEWAEARDGLIQFVNSFLHSGDVDPWIYKSSFSRATTLRAERGRISPFLKSLLTDSPNVGDALLTFRRLLEASAVGSDVAQTMLEFDELGSIVPRQQVAPARFEIIDNRIVVANKPPRTLEEDRENISSALEYIRGTGDSLIESIEQSNCDRRLLDNIKALHYQILSNENIVKIGLTNLACGVMCAQFQEELPDAINAMFNSYSASISMYVAQFPEWEQFTQKALSIELDDEDISDIDETASKIISTLETNPHLADPEVPKTIKFVREFLRHPGTSANRAVFAMLRTIENLVSSIVHHSIDLLNKTTEKTIDQLSNAASTIIVGLLSVALIGATGIGSAAVHAGAPWVKQAADAVQTQIEKLGSK